MLFKGSLWYFRVWASAWTRRILGYPSVQNLNIRRCISISPEVFFIRSWHGKDVKMERHCRGGRVDCRLVFKNGPYVVRQHRTGTRRAVEEREDRGKVHGVRDSFSRATLLRATCSAAESRSASDSTAGNRVSGRRVSPYRARDRAHRCGTFGATGTPVSVIPCVVSTEFAVARSPSVRRWRLQASRQFRAQKPELKGTTSATQTPSHPHAHADNPLRIGILRTVGNSVTVGEPTTRTCCQDDLVTFFWGQYADRQGSGFRESWPRGKGFLRKLGLSPVRLLDMRTGENGAQDVPREGEQIPKDQRKGTGSEKSKSEGESQTIGIISFFFFST